MLTTIKQTPIKLKLAALFAAALLMGCSTSSKESTSNKEVSLQPAKLFANLPEICATPDAFAIAPNGSLTLSCPNYADQSLKGELLSLSSAGDVTHLATVPTLKFKKKANPMGIAYDEHGALYVADARGPKWGRILKLSFSNGKITNTEVIASGFNPNGIRVHKGYVYASQLRMPKVKAKHTTSSIYRFSVDDRNVKVSNTLNDKHLMYYTETLNNKVNFGLDGLDFDSKGSFYTADLGDGEVYKLNLDKRGRITQKELFATVPNNVRPDGLVFDDKDNMYLAGFGLNQIYKITPNGQVSKIADYADNDGSNGQIDQPADLMVYQNKLVISNFDLMKGNGIRNSGHSKPYTISYIELD